MFNRQPFNRATSLVTGVSGLAIMKLQDSGELYKDIYYSGNTALVLDGDFDITKLIRQSSLTGIIAGSFADGTKEFINESEISELVLSGDASQLVSGEAIIELEGINLEPGDEIVIDTDKMTVTLNGTNAMKYVSDDSDTDLTLLNGVNTIIYSDNAGSRAVNIDIIWKDRWL